MAIERLEGICVLTIDSPPVNALSFEVRSAMADAIQAAARDPSIRAVVLTCAGRTFFAGADIKEFDRPFQEPLLPALLNAIEDSPKLVVAALHGSALGGGLETAIACHYRIADPATVVGLPEVTLGILPGAGGTQRLPRLAGAQAALDIACLGMPITAARALKAGVLDRLAAPGSLRDDAIAFARELLATNAPIRRTRDVTDKLAAAREQPEVFERFLRDNARQFRGYKAPARIVEAVRAAFTLSFAEGIKLEWQLLEKLLASRESAAQRYAFFAERKTRKVPGIDPGTPKRAIESAAIVGAGTMGSGIATCFLNAGIRVTLIDSSSAGLERGIAAIRATYAGSVKKGKMPQAEADRRAGLLATAAELGAVREADLVIEAVYEDLVLKKKLFAQLDGLANADALIASNTSFLSVDELAAETRRPAQVVGLHFFSPAHVMRLLEVVRGEHTSAATLATSLELARQLGKVPVVSKVCPGFIANRSMMARWKQAEALVAEGVMPWDVDRVLEAYGFPMGPFAMVDMAGLDVIGKDYPDTIMGRLVALGRFGQKNRRGFYDYDDCRHASPAAITEQVILEDLKRRGIGPNTMADAAMLERLLYPVINEGAKLVEEGIAIRASDIDVAMIAGFGWPAYTGGPMFWAETVGLGKVHDVLAGLQVTHGDFFQPAALLEELVRTNGRFTDS